MIDFPKVPNIEIRGVQVNQGYRVRRSDRVVIIPREIEPGRIEQTRESYKRKDMCWLRLSGEDGAKESFERHGIM